MRRREGPPPSASAIQTAQRLRAMASAKRLENERSQARRSFQAKRSKPGRWVGYGAYGLKPGRQTVDGKPWWDRMNSKGRVR
jgi:hypothetical protein